jgi:hypothetical protein
MILFFQVSNILMIVTLAVYAAGVMPCIQALRCYIASRESLGSSLV